MTAPLAEAGGQNGKTATATIIRNNNNGKKTGLCHIAVTQPRLFHSN